MHACALVATLEDEKSMLDLKNKQYERVEKEWKQYKQLNEVNIILVHSLVFHLCVFTFCRCNSVFLLFVFLTKLFYFRISGAYCTFPKIDHVALEFTSRQSNACACLETAIIAFIEGNRNNYRVLFFLSFVDWSDEIGSVLLCTFVSGYVFWRLGRVASVLLDLLFFVFPSFYLVLCLVFTAVFLFLILFCVCFVFSLLPPLVHIVCDYLQPSFNSAWIPTLSRSCMVSEWMHN